MTRTSSAWHRTCRMAAEVLRPLIDFIYPPRCPACGTGIGAQSGLCVDCWHGLMPPDEEVAAPGTVVAAASYSEVARKLVLAFKHGGKIALAPFLAKLIAARLSDPDPRRVIVPVPLHPLRLFRRGYNQAALLGRELERLGHGTLLVDGLQRSRWTPSLDKRSRHERATLLASAIRYNRRRESQLTGAEVILIDDVVTSGATSAACSQALRQGGARSIRIACFARVVAAPPAVGTATAAEQIESTQGPARSAKANARDHAIPGVP